MATADLGPCATHRLIDHDTTYAYAASFDAVFGAAEVEVKRVGPRAPNMSAFAERWGETLRRASQADP